MTETYATPTADDIIDDDTASSRLDRQASALIDGAEGRAFAPTASLRQAVRDDVAQARAAARARADLAREAIVEHPTKAALYAVGVGVLIGLLLGR